MLKSVQYLRKGTISFAYEEDRNFLSLVTAVSPAQASQKMRKELENLFGSRCINITIWEDDLIEINEVY
jgi:hypothetical protein